MRRGRDDDAATIVAVALGALSLAVAIVGTTYGVALFGMWGGVARSAVAADAPQVIIRACAPDAVRLCADLLTGGHDKIGACLNRQYDKLSPACRAVFIKK